MTEEILNNIKRVIQSSVPNPGVHIYLVNEIENYAEAKALEAEEEALYWVIEQGSRPNHCDSSELQLLESDVKDRIKELRQRGKHEPL